MTSPVLNPHQRRHLAVVLAGLERALSELSDGGPAEHFPRALEVRREDLPPEFALAARPLISRMMEAIARAADEWGLHPTIVSPRRSLVALLTAQMIRLEDSQSAALRGFGATDPSVAAVVDPTLEALIDDLRGLLEVLEHSRSGESEHSET